MNELSQLLDLPEAERAKRGLVHTPAEIAHQPNTWGLTFELFRSKRAETWSFLSAAGITGTDASQVIVFLVGAGSACQSPAMMSLKKW